MKRVDNGFQDGIHRYVDNELIRESSEKFKLNCSYFERLIYSHRVIVKLYWFDRNGTPRFESFSFDSNFKELTRSADICILKGLKPSDLRLFE